MTHKQFCIKQVLERIGEKNSLSSQDYLRGYLHGVYYAGGLFSKFSDLLYLEKKYIFKLPAVRVRPVAGRVGSHTTVSNAPDTFSLDDQNKIVQDQPKHGEEL